MLRLLALCAAWTALAQTGLFDAHSDIGLNPLAGSASYDPATREYRVTGGGANIWGATDAFHFLSRRISGDLVLSADIRFLGEGVNPHRKAVLMVRQDLDPDSAYADAALHGDGLTSLQHRATKSGPTAEIKSTLKGPLHLRLERRGDEFTLLAGPSPDQLTPAGPLTLKLSGPVYAGLGVCSHDANVLETAIFSNVKLEPIR